MGENAATKNNLPHYVVDFSADAPALDGSKLSDDNGHPERSGAVWTASAHIITVVIGSGVLSLAWAIAQLGWIAGPTVMFLFSFVSFCASSLLADCYRTGDPISGKINHTYMEAVQSILGGAKFKACGFIQYLNLFGVVVGYTIEASTSMTAIKKSNCFHKNGDKNPCHMSTTPYILLFGITEIVFSRIPNFDQIWWLSILAAVVSFTYSSIGLALGIAKVAATGTLRGSLTGISIGTDVTQTQKLWRSFQALGNIAFAYSYSVILIEIKDKVKSPLESDTMKKATFISVSVTTIFYMLCGCMGYAAFGDLAPGNLLNGFGFYHPYWLLDIANAAIVIHLVGAYQVFCQPIFAFVEKNAEDKWPQSQIRIPIRIPIQGLESFNVNLFRLVWRTMFVMLTTIISMLLPFFNDVAGLIGALGFWPLTVYFPVEMYIKQRKIPKWSTRWICLQMLNISCLIISIAATAGSVAGVALALKSYKPFKATT